jgi:Domain of unknown function (DUF4440)
MLLSNCEPLMLHFANTENRRLVSLCSFVSFMVAASLLIAGCAGEPKHPTWKNATGAEQHERLMWQAVRDKDWANVERHLSPTFTGVTADGRLFDRAGWLEQWKSSEMREFSLGEVQTQPEGIDMKVTYIFHGQTSAKAPLTSSGLRVVSVWQDVRGRWTLSAISMTPIQTQ